MTITGVTCETIPPLSTRPWVTTMKDSTPAWNESLIFSESYRRLLAQKTLIMFELVDFAISSSLKQARKVGRWSCRVFAPLLPCDDRFYSALHARFYAQ